MTNPYEPPNRDVRYLSFGTRLFRALRAAFREYRTGLVRENMTTFEHLWAWVSLFCLAFLLLVSFVAIISAAIYMMRSV